MRIGWARIEALLHFFLFLLSYDQFNWFNNQLFPLLAASLAASLAATLAALFARSSHIKPVIRTIERKGSYGYAVTWQNGATFIYVMKVLANLATEE